MKEQVIGMAGERNLLSQENLVKYIPSARPAIMAFVKQGAAEFRAVGGRFTAPKIMGPFASFNAVDKVIKLSRSDVAEAKLAALVEELIHFKQAQQAGVFGRRWFSQYTPAQWVELSLTLEQDVDATMRAMGFFE